MQNQKILIYVAIVAAATAVVTVVVLKLLGMENPTVIGGGVAGGVAGAVLGAWQRSRR